MVRLAAGPEHGRVYANVGGVTISDLDNNVDNNEFFSGLLHSRDLHKKETVVFEAHGILFPCAQLLLFNYAKVKTVFHSMAPLILYTVNVD